MTEKCPTCERGFNSLEDYPLIYVSSFNRLIVPSGLKFPFYDDTTFVGPDSEAFNEKPPSEVLEFFKNHRKDKKFEYDGYEWTLEGEWQSGHYYRENPDQIGTIFARLNPYLDFLDSLVGKETTKQSLLPEFPRNGYFTCSFDIPDTAYQLMFEEQTKNFESLRIAELQIMGEGLNLGSLGGPTIESFAKVGYLEYEGRIRK